ncbi:MAG: RHS repeat-associated core domain-containing protein, partial [Candidatus Electrothrix sp. AU1_5]|nr:RHS repeat-associated core domain-containing protein [Candidatus Electrothrix gigas]
DAPVTEHRYVLDGFNVLQERDGSNAVLREYTWGLNRGGGIGGLLELRQGGQHYAYLYDGKGNVDGLIDDAEAMVAGYVYSPFGRLLTKTGSLDQPFRFSTKAFDEQTGLAYYGYRFYAPGVGRWINRDPIGEAGGINLYGFVGNDPIDNIDYLGLKLLHEKIKDSQASYDKLNDWAIKNDPFYILVGWADAVTMDGYTTIVEKIAEWRNDKKTLEDIKQCKESDTYEAGKFLNLLNGAKKGISSLSKQTAKTIADYAREKLFKNNVKESMKLLNESDK